MFQIKNFSFAYDKNNEPVLRNIDLNIDAGDFVVLCGTSGSGKTTLLRNLKRHIMPKGVRTGEILFEGKSFAEVDDFIQTKEIAYVAQDPHSQIVTDKVWHELAFGLENLGVPGENIRLKVAEVAAYFGINKWFHQDTASLSGGQKQLLNLAAVMVLDPKILLLDEPTSQLDPVSAQEFLETVARLNEEMGTTVVITEHRLDRVLSMSGKVIMLDKGELYAQGKPGDFCMELLKRNHPMVKAMPIPFQAYSQSKKVGKKEGKKIGEVPPINVRQGRRWLENMTGGKYLHPTWIKSDVKKGTVLEAKDIWFKYGKSDEMVISGLNLKIARGEIFAILGGNATGKTTLLSLFGGIRKPFKGKIKVKNKDIDKIDSGELYGKTLGLVPQDPCTLFSYETVGEELTSMKDAKEEDIKNIISLLSLEKLLNRHPYDISGGEQQHLALGKILLLDPEILLLDEPTKGTDGGFKEELCMILKKLSDSGKTVVMVSHDVEFCAKSAHRCAMLFDGEVTSIGHPREFFSGNSYYTTSGNKMARNLIEGAITAEDISAALRDCDEEENKSLTKGFSDKRENKKQNDKVREDRERNSFFKSLKTGVFFPSVLIAAFVMMLTMVIEGDSERKYLLVSLIFVFSAMIPFYVIFERQKNTSGQMILVSVWIALTVAGRGLFFALPNMKPVFALIIIGGLFMGPASGFVMGSMTAFVSNFIFGQGPWTVFQMLAWGLIGFGAGLLGFKLKYEEKRISKYIAVGYGILSTFLFHGLITDIWTILFMNDRPNWTVVISVYAAGLFTNLLLALSTALFLFIIFDPMMKKLWRLEKKYDIS